MEIDININMEINIYLSISMTLEELFLEGKALDKKDKKEAEVLDVDDVSRVLEYIVRRGEGVRMLTEKLENAVDSFFWVFRACGILPDLWDEKYG